MRWSPPPPNQTLRSDDIDAARQAFLTRLRALANAHDLLTETRWTAASMRGVLGAALAAHAEGNERVSISGPDLDLTPKMALSLALAVNELTTNAAKYGALSNEAGRVEIAWSKRQTDPDGGRQLEWTWREHGGPPVTAPSRSGFGSILITRVLAADFGAEARIDYPPEGVTCVLTMPLVNLHRVA